MKPSNSFPAWKELYVHIIPCNFSSCRERLSGMVSLLFRGGRTQQKYNAHALSPIFLKHTYQGRQTTELYDNKLYITL